MTTNLPATTTPQSATVADSTPDALEQWLTDNGLAATWHAKPPTLTAFRQDHAVHGMTAADYEAYQHLLAA